MQLNGISSANRGSYRLWSATLERSNLIISLETNDDISDFDELICEELIPILKSIKSYRDTLVFDESYYNCCTNIQGYSNMYLYDGRLIRVSTN